MNPQTESTPRPAIFRPELVTLLQKERALRVKEETSRENSAHNLDRQVEKGVIKRYPGQPGYYELPAPEALNLILEEWSGIEYCSIERPPMTLARARYYLGTYRLFRKANPLPEGWTDDTSPLEAFIQQGEWTDQEVTGFRFRNGSREAQINVDRVGELEVNLSDHDGHGFTAHEIFDLLAELIGSHPDAVEELEHQREMEQDFPAPPCPGKTWNDFFYIEDDVFNC